MFGFFKKKVSNTSDDIKQTKSDGTRSTVQVTREALAYEKGLVEGSLDKGDKFHGHRTPEGSLPDNIRSARGALVVILCHVYHVSIQPSAKP